jgi:hypothetical protein
MISENASPANTLQCDICIKEIPTNVGNNAEADEYISHYFGLECYQQWHDMQDCLSRPVTARQYACHEKPK